VDLLDFLDQMEKMVNRVLMVYLEALDLPVYLDQRCTIIDKFHTAIEFTFLLLRSCLNRSVFPLIDF